MNDIKERKLRKWKGKQKTTLLNDGDKVWKVVFERGTHVPSAAEGGVTQNKHTNRK